MVQYVFTPWRDRAELLLVRDQLYKTPVEPLEQHKAVARASMWMQRGNCPHMVESTALLTAAVLSDADAAASAGASTYAVRAAYSAAFSRFVTGLLDGHQDKLRKQSMYSIAKVIGLPATFVELRHQATHEQLPSLAKLRPAAQKALVWIWDYYWKHLDAGEGASASKADPCCETVLAYLREEDETKKQAVVARMAAFRADALLKAVTQLQDSLPGNQVFLKCLKLSKDIMAGTIKMAPEDEQETKDMAPGEKTSDETVTIQNISPDEADIGWSRHAGPWKPKPIGMRAVAVLLGAQPSREPIRRHAGPLTNSFSTAPLINYRLTRCHPIASEKTSMSVNRLLCRASTFRTAFTRISAPPGISRAMHIQSIPMWVGTSNNYAYLVTDDKTKESVIIDPANPPEVAPVIKEAVESGRINFTSIVNTHHHWDHAGGNKALLEALGHPKVEIVGGKDCEGATRTPGHTETFKIGDINVRAVHTPCHTQDSICYFMEDSTGKAVFTGDTLFISGCGRFFEGTAAEMHEALNKRLAALPDDTVVYPGHEYTKANVQFTVSVSQTEPIKKLEEFAANNQVTTGKFTIGDEKKHNVFMRVEDPEIQKATGETDPVSVMAKLREMKNNFKPPAANL